MADDYSKFIPPSGMVGSWGTSAPGLADFIRQYDPQTGHPVDPTQGQQATFGANPPHVDPGTQQLYPGGSGHAPSDTSWWSAPANPPQGAASQSPSIWHDPSQSGAYGGSASPPSIPGYPVPGAGSGGYAPDPTHQGAYGGYAPDPTHSAPPTNPGQVNGSYFPTTTMERAMYDMNPTLAFQRMVSATVGNANSPQYAWARAQYQRYYQDYVAQNAADPAQNLTFTQYLDQKGPALAQEFGNAPASARGVNNTWLTSGRFTS